jgi:hypothetical protein
VIVRGAPASWATVWATSDRARSGRSSPDGPADRGEWPAVCWRALARCVCVCVRRPALRRARDGKNDRCSFKRRRAVGTRSGRSWRATSVATDAELCKALCRYRAAIGSYAGVPPTNIHTDQRTAGLISAAGGKLTWPPNSAVTREDPSCTSGRRSAVLISGSQVPCAHQQNQTLSQAHVFPEIHRSNARGNGSKSC